MVSGVTGTPPVFGPQMNPLNPAGAGPATMPQDTFVRQAPHTNWWGVGRSAFRGGLWGTALGGVGTLLTGNPAFLMFGGATGAGIGAANNLFNQKAGVMPGYPLPYPGGCYPCPYPCYDPWTPILWGGIGGLMLGNALTTGLLAASLFFPWWGFGWF